MSGSDQRDQDKGFLARWSRRKQEAKQPDREAPAADANTPPGPAAEGDAEPEFDLSSLPKLEDVTETTDITAFLRKGVPEHLRNAALRKSWALDPAIRNYVNPALEYAYDWNTPGGVPGSSEIGAGVDVARLVSQIMGEGKSTHEASTSVAEPGKEPASDAAQSGEHDATQRPEPDLPTQASSLDNETTAMMEKARNSEAGSGVEPERAKASEASSIAPQQARRHGSAKPTD
jgi:Protein of unknown function (DUF3306)